MMWRKDESHICNSNNNWWNNIADVLSNHNKTIKIIIDKKEIEIKVRADDIDLLLKIISVFNVQ